MFRNVFDTELYSNIIQPVKKNRNSTNEFLDFNKKKLKNLTMIYIRLNNNTLV